MVLHGRRKLRRLSNLRLHLIENLLPQVRFDSREGEICPSSLFPEAEEIFLEIGFGSGEHMISMATSSPRTGFLGVEPLLNGIGRVLSQMTRYNIHNLLLSSADGEETVRRLTSESINRCFILFPDPWNKRAHFKRRFINEKNCQEIHRILKPGGSLFLATDHENYAKHMIRVLEGSLLNLKTHSSRHLQGDLTRYEKKAIDKGKQIYYMEADKG